MDGQQLQTIPTTNANNIIGVEDMKEWYRAFAHFTKSILKKDIDYGSFGSGTKPSLYKAGAEKLRFAYSLEVNTNMVERTLDIQQGFVTYTYKVSVKDRTGRTIGECEGSCNSFEDKYLYRWTEAPKPSDEEAGRLKLEGTGRFKKSDNKWIWQSRVKISKEQVLAYQNTIQKMAQKRAFVGAILLATGASEFFTQDLEDMILREDTPPAEDPKAATAETKPKANTNEKPKGDAPKPAPDKQKSTSNAKTMTGQAQKPWLDPGTKEWDNAFDKFHKGEIDLDGILEHYRINKRDTDNLFNPHFKFKPATK